MEGMLPGYIWKQFGYLFPNTEFEIHLIGPEAYYDKSCKSSLLSAIQMEGH